MDKIQLIFFFIAGYLVSRLIIKVRLPQRIVYWFIGKRRLSISKILFYIIAISAFLSFFIPNAITVLTLLPLLELLRRSFKETNNAPKSIATMLALAAIYGANIGGMGSVTATPANGILVSYSVLNNVPGIGYVTFASWLIWGIPLVIIFVCVAWVILTQVMRSGKYRNCLIRLPFSAAQVTHPHQKAAIWIMVFYFLASFVLSLLLMYYSDKVTAVLAGTGILTLLFILFLFWVPIRGSDGSRPKEVLLKLPDCYNEMPTKGFVFVGIAVVIAALLYMLNIHEYFSRWAGEIIPTGVSAFLLFLLVALASSFSTEVLSNTAVQISFFVVALPLAAALDFSALAILIIITLASTSAFMSPIATGVNGLAFGGVKGVSLNWMLLVGFFMNIAGGLLISGWTYFIISHLYHLR